MKKVILFLSLFAGLTVAAQNVVVVPPTPKGSTSEADPIYADDSTALMAYPDQWRSDISDSLTESVQWADTTATAGVGIATFDDVRDTAAAIRADFPVAGGAADYEDVTYQAFYSLITTNTLVEATYYRITDFATVHYFTDGTTTIDTAINTGTVEPLILLATSDSTIDGRAYSPLFPNDVLEYDWDENNWLDDYSFADTGVIVTGWKGVITYRWDTKADNETGYDFRNVKFRRWAIDSPMHWADDLYYSWNSEECNGLGVDGEDYEDVYTFHDDYTLFHQNHIGVNEYKDGELAPYFSRLNNIVFYGGEIGEGQFFGAWNNTFEPGCYQMTYGSGCYSMTYGSECHSMTYDSDCFGMTYGIGCSSMTYGSDCNSMTYGIGCSSMTYGSDCFGMTYGSGCHSMTYDSGCYSMTYGSGCSYMTYGSGCYSMTYGSGCSYMTYGSGCGYINHESGIESFTFAASTTKLTILNHLSGCDLSAVDLTGDYDKTILKASTGELILKYDAYDTDHFETVWVEICAP